MWTRRNFAFAGLGIFTEAALAQRALVGSDWPPDTVWLNANENPEGVPARSLEAIARTAPEAWRYHYPDFRNFHAKLAQSEKLEPAQIVTGAGSTDVLNAAVAAFTSADHPVITAEPTFEVPREMARALGRPFLSVPLTEGYAADVKRMAALAEQRGGGLIYLCNPNNPTSSLTPRPEVDWLAQNLPAQTVLLVDEAYIHFLDDYDAHSALAHVRAGRNVVVARTFSKVYGMAGLRVGFAAATPELAAQMRRYRNNVVSWVSARAVEAALEDRGLIAQRRARLVKIRTGLCEWLRAKGLKYIEPHANFMMIETGRDAGELGLALLRKSVAAGRPFPPYEKTMLRVSIGSKADMDRFKQALTELL